MSAKSKPPPSISDQLRALIRDSGKTVYAISKESDVDRGQILRLLSGERSPKLETVDKLAAVLKFKLCRR